MNVFSTRVLLHPNTPIEINMGKEFIDYVLMKWFGNHIKPLFDAI